ncbi:hypothetical protein [Delftia tsuruhatensis]|uniref:hypothetical protein n=1 Tax=Delftia tsuruhatensis TaxID=180282 RepID=UPI001F45F5D6|nr:hypothetical protein [Delftia tsuruhatensis]
MTPKIAKIFLSIISAALLSGCFWYEEPWFGDASVVELGGFPCFGIPKGEISDAEKTRISSVSVSQGGRSLWRYSEDNYEKMELAFNSCISYGAVFLDAKPDSINSKAEYGLKPGVIYDVLVRTRQSQNKFNRMFYVSEFCLRYDAEGRVVVFEVKDSQKRICPDVDEIH